MRNMTFCTATLCCFFLWVVNGVCGDSDEVKSVSVMEGHSVTLHTDLTHIQTHDQILWQFGPQEIRIAEIHKKTIDMYDSKKIFGDRLQLDSQTGSLTITNISITNSGLYKLQIISDRGTSYKRFNVTVYARLPVPDITRDCTSSKRSSSLNCSLLCLVLNVSHVTLSWYKENSLLSSISVSDLNIRLSLPLEVKYQDTNTYSCVLNNTITNHTTHLNINQLCVLPEHSLHIVYTAVIIVLCVCALLGGLAAVFVLRRKSRKADRNGTPAKAQIHYQPNGTVQVNRLLEEVTIIPRAANETNCAMLKHPNEEDDSQISMLKHPNEEDDSQISGEISEKSSQNCVIPWIDETDDDLYPDEAKDHVDNDLMMTLSVKEGDSVTLQNDVIAVKEDEEMLWKFAESKVTSHSIKFKIIAKRTRANDWKFVCISESFKDRLQLDDQTGSLTITNFIAEDTGHYKLCIPKKGISKTFNVTKKVSTLQRRNTFN